MDLGVKSKQCGLRYYYNTQNNNILNSRWPTEPATDPADIKRYVNYVERYGLITRGSCHNNGLCKDCQETQNWALEIGDGSQVLCTHDPADLVPMDSDPELSDTPVDFRLGYHIKSIQTYCSWVKYNVYTQEEEKQVL